MKRLKAGSKLLAALGVLCVMGVLTAKGTTAYLTDNESASNLFTVGKVQADLSEPDYPGNNTGSSTDLVPNQEVPKNPRVTNTGENDMLVFMVVEVPVDDVTLVSDDGTKGDKEVTDLFWLKKNSDPVSCHANHFDESWVPLTARTIISDVPGISSRYVFGYESVIPKGSATSALFEKVQLKNIIENEVTPGKDLEIKVDAYAIQASNIFEGDIDLATDLDETNLEKIYDIYLNQADL